MHNAQLKLGFYNTSSHQRVTRTWISPRPNVTYAGHHEDNRTDYQRRRTQWTLTELMKNLLWDARATTSTSTTGYIFCSLNKSLFLERTGHPLHRLNGLSTTTIPKPTRHRNESTKLYLEATDLSRDVDLDSLSILVRSSTPRTRRRPALFRDCSPIKAEQHQPNPPRPSPIPNSEQEIGKASTTKSPNSIIFNMAWKKPWILSQILQRRSSKNTWWPLDVDLNLSTRNNLAKFKMTRQGKLFPLFC